MATLDVAAELPFMLNARFADPAVEAAPLDHVDWDDWLLQVNGARWAPLLTTENRYAMLPADWSEVDLVTTWTTMQFIETGSMVSGVDRTSIGLATANAIVATTRLDHTVDSPRYPVVMSRRGQTDHDDARLIVDWITGNDLSDYLGVDTRMLVRLFAAAANDTDGQQVWYGDYLAVGTSSQEAIGGTPSSEWFLGLEVSPEVTASALDTIAAISTEFNDIVTAARDPESPAGRAWIEQLSESGL